MATSIVGSNFVVRVPTASLTASSGAYSLSLSIRSATARYALLRCMCWVLSFRSGERGQVWSDGPARPCHGVRCCWCFCGARSAVDGDAHRAGGPLDDLHRGIEVVGVDVGELGGGDLAHLVA